jgi:hypothetical protein
MYIIGEEGKSIQIFGRETCGESHKDDWEEDGRTTLTPYTGRHLSLNFC